MVSFSETMWPKAVEELNGQILMGAAVYYNEQLKKEYTDLYRNNSINPSREAIVAQRVKIIGANKARYQAVEKVTTVPWWMIACIHQMECSGDFKKHLHNGDPLTGKTTHVPKNRPLQGQPPYTWEASAIDALSINGEKNVKDRSLPAVLYRFELYNGMGYRQYHPKVKSPYLWSFTTAYVKGKYVADGKFDPNAVSQQIGVVCYLKAMKIF